MFTSHFLLNAKLLPLRSIGSSRKIAASLFMEMDLDSLLCSAALK